VAVTPDGSKVYVANFNDNTVSVIATATNMVIGSPIPVGLRPVGVAVTPDGSKVFVANNADNTVSVIATATNTVSTIPAGTGPEAFGIFIVQVTPLSLRVFPATNIASAGTQGGPFSPASFSYTLNSTSGNVNYTISGLPQWLTASSTSGTVTASGTMITFSLAGNAKNLTPGTYNATIAFTNTTNGRGNTTRTVTLTVNTIVPVLLVSPKNDLKISGRQGQFSSESFSYTLSATMGTGTLGYSISGIPPWLTATSDLGTVTTGAPITITFTVNSYTNSLAIGAYGASIAFTNTTTGQGSTTRSPTLTVKK
jgi:YVTN family beta-propeller protein